MTTQIKEEDFSDELLQQSNICGEIFVTKRGIFSCFCIVCKQMFTDIGYFTEHILTLHLGLIPSTTDNIPNKNKINPLDSITTNFLEIKTNENENENIDSTSIKPADKNFELTLQKNVETTDPLDIFNSFVQPQHGNKISLEADQKLEESEISKFTTTNDSCTSHNSSETSDSNEDEEFDLCPFKCDICKRGFKIKHALLSHKKRHETSMPNCQHCGKHFREITSFKSHNQILCAQRIKRGKKLKIESPYLKCKYCVQTFKKKAFLKKHEERHECPPFQCNICSKKFMVQHVMKDHLRTHTGEKPYKCEYCPVSFANATNLKRHILIHVGERTYICTLGCGKGFFTERERTGHERSHTGEKPFVCELCGRYFAFQHQLSLHKRRFHMDKKNWPHKCDQCDKVFLMPQQLREHNVVHTGEKPFACDQCSGRFSKSSGLREHKKLHSGVKKHVCTICNKAFAQTAGLYSHMKSHCVVKEVTEIS